MSITYPPEMLPVPDVDDEIEIIIVDGMSALTAEELACGLAIRRAEFDGVLRFRNMSCEEFYAKFPPKAAKD